MRTRLLYILAALTLTACGNQASFEKVEKTSSATFGEIFGSIKPALIVRNTGCIMCHAQINGDLITDLGFGDSFFMGSDAPANHPRQGNYSAFRSHHFIWFDANWKTSALFGNVVVPETTIQDPVVLNAYRAVPGNIVPASGLKLTQFLQSRFVNPEDATQTPSFIIDRTASNDPNVNGLRGQFMSRKSMKISAPTEDEVRALSGIKGMSRVATGGDTSLYQASKSLIQGLRIKTGNSSKTYVTNDQGPVKCFGDVVIDGVAFFNNLQLDTDGMGCRLYVSKSVFIQGPITYVGGDQGGKNLQISAARAIVIGMWSMKSRFTQDATVGMLGGIHNAPTDDLEQAFYNKVISDRDRLQGLTDDAGPFRVMRDKTTREILAYMDSFDTQVWKGAPGHPTFPDPATCTETGPCTTGWAEDYMRKSYDYQHVIFNAPSIQGRYHGKVVGALLGDKVLMAVGRLIYFSDPTLEKVPFLPLVADKVSGISLD